MKVEGAVALVSGGASGLGEAAVRKLVASGAMVVIVDRDEARGEALALEMGRVAAFHKADVTSAPEIVAAVEKAKAMGPVRIAVNCAGVAPSARTLARDGTPHDLEVFQRVIMVNLIGTFNMTRLAAATIASAAPLADGERGVIVNTASIAAFDGQIGQVAYAASKGGVVGMTLPIARDLSSVGIRVCAIAPGTFDTPMLAAFAQPVRDALAATIPFPRRLGLPADFAALVAHIVENPYLNGETIRLDGALRMAPR